MEPWVWRGGAELPIWLVLSSYSRPGPEPARVPGQVLPGVLPAPQPHPPTPWPMPWLIAETRDSKETSRPGHSALHVAQEAARCRAGGQATWPVTSLTGQPFPRGSRCCRGLGGHFVAGEGQPVQSWTQCQPITKWGGPGKGSPSRAWWPAQQPPRISRRHQAGAWGQVVMWEMGPGGRGHP